MSYKSKGRPHYLLDAFTAVSHILVGLLAALFLETVVKTPWYIRVILVVAYLLLVYLVYRKIKQYEAKREETDLARWRRYQFLQSHLLSVTNEFLKDRYKINHDLAAKLNDHVDDNTITAASIQSLLEEHDKQRREQIKSALSSLSNFLPTDNFARPEDPDLAVQDRVKVSFFAVEHDPEVNEICLVPKYRFYPNEGQPITKRFKKGEGAAGIAWDMKRIVVCESGGKEQIFKDMWEGGGQKKHYASMICVPAIEDIPAEKLSEVYGVLTIDTPTRRGYFQKNLAQFWADLFEPICNLLIHCHEAERVKKALIRGISVLDSARAQLNETHRSNLRGIAEEGGSGDTAACAESPQPPQINN